MYFIWSVDRIKSSYMLEKLLYYIFVLRISMIKAFCQNWFFDLETT